MDVRLRELAAKQDDLAAGWQLRRCGWTRAMIEHHAHHAGWRVIHPGVYVLSHSPLTQRQRWVAATLHGHTMCHDGLRAVTAARALIDLAPHLSSRQLGRAFREAARLKLHTTNELAQVVRVHRGRRGIAALVALCDRYASIPYHRCRSDAECLALEILHDAGVAVPLVNVEVAGREADLTWHARKLIVEIDGPQWHLFRDQDAIKEARWRSAGYTVRRIPSDDVYDRPVRLLALSQS